MKKDITICFRTSQELKDALELKAKNERRNMSNVIEMILEDALRIKMKDEGVED